MLSSLTGRSAAQDSLETLSKVQIISYDVSGPVKAICFPLPWVRWQDTETQTSAHTTFDKCWCCSSGYSTFSTHSLSSFGSGYIFLYYLSLFLFIFSWFHPFPHIIWNSSSALFPLASLRDLHMLFILGCILLWCPCEPELEVRAGLVHLCISCFTESETRWNEFCLTLILLSYLCFFPHPPKKEEEKKEENSQLAVQFEALRGRWKGKVCNWGPEKEDFTACQREL